MSTLDLPLRRGSVAKLGMIQFVESGADGFGVCVVEVGEDAERVLHIHQQVRSTRRSGLGMGAGQARQRAR
jgi:hypothetical protein